MGVRPGRAGPPHLEGQVQGLAGFGQVPDHGAEGAELGEDGVQIGARAGGHRLPGGLGGLLLGQGLGLRLVEVTERQAVLQREYDAITLAMEVLALSSSNLQSRFSPALGERAASIFTNLTGGRYNKVVLDRSMTPSAQQAGQLLPHEAGQLSQGTEDQLYLAVRLALDGYGGNRGRAVPQGLPAVARGLLLMDGQVQLPAHLEGQVQGLAGFGQVPDHGAEGTELGEDGVQIGARAGGHRFPGGLGGLLLGQGLGLRLVEGRVLLDGFRPLALQLGAAGLPLPLPAAEGEKEQGGDRRSSPPPWAASRPWETPGSCASASRR